MSQQNPIQEQIIAKAMNEEPFRQELLSNPKAAIERALGISVPQDLTIMVHENTPTTLHLVLPAQVQMRDLSDAELEQASGGQVTPWTGSTRMRGPKLRTERSKRAAERCATTGVEVQRWQ